MQLQREMNALYLISRVFVGFLGLAALLGVVWFAGSLRYEIMLSGVLIGLTSVVVALVPRAILENKIARMIIVLACSIGAASGVFLVADRFGNPRGIQWHALLVDLLHVSALLVIAYIAWRGKLQENGKGLY